jgi:hypothetical protein
MSENKERDVRLRINQSFEKWNEINPSKHGT